MEAAEFASHASTHALILRFACGFFSILEPPSCDKLGLSLPPGFRTSLIRPMHSFRVSRNIDLVHSLVALHKASAVRAIAVLYGKPFIVRKYII